MDSYYAGERFIMSEKKGIENTKLIMENWKSHLGEAGLGGLNRDKIVQLLKRMSGQDNEQEIGDEDIVGSEDLPGVPGGDGPNDAMPADGADDDNVVDDVDIIDSGNDLSHGDIMVVMNQLRNTGGLSFEDLGNETLNRVRDAIGKTIDTLGSRQGASSKDKAQDAENIKEVGGRILKRLELAFEKLFNPRTLVDLQEVLKVVKNEERKALNENKRLVITIKG